jgi:hypothetical protein
MRNPIVQADDVDCPGLVHKQIAVTVPTDPLHPGRADPCSEQDATACRQGPGGLPLPIDVRLVQDRQIRARASLETALATEERPI